MNLAKIARDKVTAQRPDAVVVERGRNYIKHRDGGTYILDACTGPMHYGPSMDQEIDTAWQLGTAPWDYEMVQAGYNAYALEDFSSGQIIKYVDPVSGESIGFQPQQLQYTNDLDQIQAIADPQSVVCAVDDDDLYWTGAFGTDIDIKWETQTARLAKRLIIQDASALPTVAQYIIDGGNPVLRLQFIFQKSPGLDIYVNDTLWDELPANPVETSGRVEFRLGTGEVAFAFNIPLSVSSGSDEATDEIIGTFRLRKVGPNLFVEHLVPISWLQLEDYPIEIDVDVDEQVAGNYDDAHERQDDTDFDNSSYRVQMHGHTSASIRFVGGYRFTTVAIPKDATITAAHFEGYPYDDVYLDLWVDVYGEDEDDVDDYNTTQDVYNRTTTSASYEWQVTMTVDQWESSPSTSLNGIISEITSRSGWATGQDLGILIWGHTPVSGSYLSRFSSYNRSSTDAAKLHVEYSVDQTVVMDELTLASTIEDLSVLATIPMDELTLASTIEDITVPPPNPPPIATDELTLASTPEDLTVAPGEAIVFPDELTAIASPEDITPVGGPISVPLDELTLASSCEALTLVAVVFIGMDELTLESTTVALDIIADYTALMDELTLAGSTSLTIVPGPVSPLIDELALASTLEDLNVTVGEIIILDELTLASTLEDLTVQPGEVSLALNELTLAGSAEALSVSTETAISLDELTLTGSAETITVAVGVITIGMDTLTLAGTLEDVRVARIAQVSWAVFEAPIPIGVFTDLDTLTITPTLEMSVAPGPVTIQLDELTLASSIEDLSITLSVPLDELTLASTAEGLTLVATASIPLDELTLDSSCEALTLVAVVSIPMDELTLAGSVEDLAVTPDSTIVTQQLTLVSHHQSLVVIPGGASVPLGQITLAGTAEALSVAVGAIQIELDELSLTGSPENLTVVPGDVSVPLDELTLASTVEDLNVAVPGTISMASLTLASSAEFMSIVPISASSITLASSVETITVQPGPISIPMDELTLTGTAETLTPVGGPVTVTLSTITLASTLSDLVLFSEVFIPASELTLASTIEDITVVAGSFIQTDTLTLGSSVEAISVVPGEVSPAISTLTLAGSIESIIVVPGPTAVELDELPLTATASLDIFSTVSIAVDELALSASALGIIVVPGPTSVVLPSIALDGSAVTLYGIHRTDEPPHLILIGSRIDVIALQGDREL